MPIQRFDIAQNLARLFELVGIELSAAHQKAHRTARIHHVTTDTAIEIFLLCDRIQYGSGILVGQLFLQHAATDVFQALINTFQRIGGILCVSGIQVEQNILVVADGARTRTRPHAHQPEHRQVIGMH